MSTARNGNGSTSDIGPDAVTRSSPHDPPSALVSNLAMSRGLSLHGSVDPVEEERDRLETDIAVAKARLFAAKYALAQLDAQTKQALRAELAESRDRLADLDGEHAAAARRIREGSAAMVKEILDDAQRRAADIEAAGTAAP